MAESRPQPPLPDRRRGVKPGLHNLLLRERLLEGGAGEAPHPWQPPSARSCRLVLQPLSVAGGNPQPAVGAHRTARTPMGTALPPQSHPPHWLEHGPGQGLLLHGGSACGPTGSAVLGP